MISHHRARPALLSALAVLLPALIGAGFPGASAGQAGRLPNAAAAGPAASQPCDTAPTFSASNYPDLTVLPKTGESTMYPLVPGTEYTLEGVANDGSGLVGHKIVSTITDLTKVVNGVKTWVVWDRDFSLNVTTQQYELTESELAFHALDNFNNAWNLGEYPAQYVGEVFTDAPDTWFAGLASKTGQAKAQGGWILPGMPQVQTKTFLQAYAPGIIGDCGRVSAVDQQHICNSTTGLCYDHVLVVDETSPGEPGTQQKFYVAGVGNFKIGAINDPQGETQELTRRLQLSLTDCIAARDAALALEDQAYHHDPSQTVYAQTTPMQQTGLCESTAPTATPTPSVSPTPIATPTLTPTPPTPAPLGTTVFLPIAARNIVGLLPPPPVYDGCQSDPNPGSAANFPVRIVKVDKVAEIVTLQNISSATISLEDWNMCSLATNKDHDQIFGTIAPGQTRSFKNIGDGPVWNDQTRNDGALYNAAGLLVSYWVDQ